MCPIPQGYSGAIQKERDAEKLQPAVEFGNTRCRHRQTASRVIRSFLDVAGGGSPALTNQACKGLAEYCKRVIAPATGDHHDHPGKVAGAIWRDCSSRCSSSGMGLSWRQLGTRHILVVSDSGHARWQIKFTSTQHRQGPHCPRPRY